MLSSNYDSPFINNFSRKTDGEDNAGVTWGEVLLSKEKYASGERSVAFCLLIAFICFLMNIISDMSLF